MGEFQHHLQATGNSNWNSHAHCQTSKYAFEVNKTSPMSTNNSHVQLQAVVLQSHLAHQYSPPTQPSYIQTQPWQQRNTKDLNDSDSEAEGSNFEQWKYISTSTSPTPENEQHVKNLMAIMPFGNYIYENRLSVEHQVQVR